MAASPFRIYVVATFDDSDFTSLDFSVAFDSCHGGVSVGTEHFGLDSFQVKELEIQPGSYVCGGVASLWCC
jgi:hypothetical protein